jgi:hypothetical protein
LGAVVLNERVSILILVLSSERCSVLLLFIPGGGSVKQAKSTNIVTIP